MSAAFRGPRLQQQPAGPRAARTPATPAAQRGRRGGDSRPRPRSLHRRPARHDRDRPGRRTDRPGLELLRPRRGVPLRNRLSQRPRRRRRRGRDAVHGRRGGRRRGRSEPADSRRPGATRPRRDSSTAATAAARRQPAMRTRTSSHLTDFVSSVPPVGATVDIYWGRLAAALTRASPRAPSTRTGIVFFPPPPGQRSFRTTCRTGLEDVGQESEYWISAVIVPPPGATSFNSLSATSLGELLTRVLGSETPNPALAPRRDRRGRLPVPRRLRRAVPASRHRRGPVTGTAPGDAAHRLPQNNLPYTGLTVHDQPGGAIGLEHDQAPASDADDANVHAPVPGNA